tara:strand:- start:181 stop:465 length:285 start_codon:yes stop_codon:yes gene_type:complete
MANPRRRRNTKDESGATGVKRRQRRVSNFVSNIVSNIKSATKGKPKPPKRKKPKKQKNDGQGAINVQTSCMQGTCNSKIIKRKPKSNRNNYGRN